MHGVGQDKEWRNRMGGCRIKESDIGDCLLGDQFVSAAPNGGKVQRGSEPKPLVYPIGTAAALWSTRTHFGNEVHMHSFGS